MENDLEEFIKCMRKPGSNWRLLYRGKSREHVMDECDEELRLLDIGQFKDRTKDYWMNDRTQDTNS